MKYHANLSPRSLTTVTDHMSGYPAYWELMKWYLCWRKYPYPSEVIAALMAEVRPEGYSHYPCPVDPTHWHIGRGHRDADKKKRHAQAKRVYRKAVRDEIWRAHVVREETATSEQRAAALAD